jgi:hypothetical protein
MKFTYSQFKRFHARDLTAIKICHYCGSDCQLHYDKACEEFICVECLEREEKLAEIYEEENC